MATISGSIRTETVAVHGSYWQAKNINIISAGDDDIDKNCGMRICFFIIGDTIYNYKGSKNYVKKMHWYGIKQSRKISTKNTNGIVLVYTGSFNLPRWFARSNFYLLIKHIKRVLWKTSD